MSRNRREGLRVEPLEGKLLLSTARASAVAAQFAPAQLQSLSLAGTLQLPTGTIATLQTGGQEVGTYKLRGKLGSMGAVTGTFVAALDSSGSMSVGEIVLSGRKGKVNLIVTMDPADNTAYDYTIASGSGAFAAATGSGKIATSGIANGGKTVLFSVTTN